MTHGPTRRRLLLALGGLGTTALAGCPAGETATTGDEPPPTTEDTRSSTATKTARPSGSTEPTTTGPPATATEGSRPATLALADLSVDSEPLRQFQPVTLTPTLENVGGTAATVDLALAVDEEWVRTGTVTVPAESVRDRAMTLTEGVVGTHDLTLVVRDARTGQRIDGTTRTLTVARFPEEFVGVDGPEFTCGGGSLYLNGSNDQQVVATQVPTSRIERVFALAADLGMNVMRVFGFAPSWSDGAAQPSAGAYNETFFRRFDRVVAAAKRHGIRLIVPLVNDNRQVDSIARYVEWVDGASEHNDFYEVEACRDLYRQYVRHVLTRRNPLTGLEYREDPTIMLWELGNELNCEWPKKYPLDWIEEMGSFVKKLDGNHLLSTGIVGLQWGDDPNDKQSWRDGIDPRTTLVVDHEPAVIDAVSVHFYPDPAMGDLEPERIPDVIRDIVRTGRNDVGKPVYFGEFNWGVRGGDPPASRNEHLATWYDVFAEERLNGAVIHEISTTAKEYRGAHNIFPETDAGTAKLLRSHSQWARETSTGDCPASRSSG